LGTMAGNAVLAGSFGDVSSSDHHDMFNGYKQDAQVALEYLRRSTPPEVAELKAIIRGGENKNREFKSSLRNPITEEPVVRNGKTLTKKEIKKSLEKAVLKTIAAFMNTEGGTLLIGVQDDGVELGIEHDQFENRDKYQLHLTNIIKQNLGSIAAAAIEIQIISLNSKDICRVDCVKIKDGVYLGGSEFYVRTGPSTTLLSEDQIPKHIQNRI